MKRSYVIRNIGLLYDGVSDKPVSDAVVQILHDSIEYAGPKTGSPSCTTENELDAKGAVALPGLIDLHTHALIDEDSLGSFLRNGVTTIRDLGSDAYRAVGWKKRERANKVLAPRIFASGPILTCPGGYPDNVWGNNIAWPLRGRYHAQEKVKKIVAMQLDIVKVGLEDELGPCLSETEMKAVIAQAEESGVPSTVHLTSASDFELALRSGLREVAHVPSRPMHDDLWREAAKKKVRIVPTIHAHSGWAEEWKRRRNHPFGEHCIKGFQQGYWQSIRNLEKFLSFGGEAVYGTDAGNPNLPFGASGAEWKDLMKTGLSVTQCLRMSTSKAAEVLGIGDKTGSLVKGKWADLALYREDPMRDPDDFKTIQMVFKAGVLVHPGPMAFPVPFDLDYWIGQFEKTGFKPRIWNDEKS